MDKPRLNNVLHCKAMIRISSPSPLHKTFSSFGSPSNSDSLLPSGIFRQHHHQIVFGPTQFLLHPIRINRTYSFDKHLTYENRFAYHSARLFISPNIQCPKKFLAYHSGRRPMDHRASRPGPPPAACLAPLLLDHRNDAPAASTGSSVKF